MRPAGQARAKIPFNECHEHGRCDYRSPSNDCGFSIRLTLEVLLTTSARQYDCVDHSTWPRLRKVSRQLSPVTNRCEQASALREASPFSLSSRSHTSRWSYSNFKICLERNSSECSRRWCMRNQGEASRWVLLHCSARVCSGWRRAKVSSCLPFTTSLQMVGLSVCWLAKLQRIISCFGKIVRRKTIRHWSNMPTMPSGSAKCCKVKPCKSFLAIGVTNWAENYLKSNSIPIIPARRG